MEYITVPATSTSIGTSSTYTITCTGSGGTATDSVVINWTSAIATIELDIDGQKDGVSFPDSFAFNHYFVLNWSAANVDSCNISTACTQGSTISGYSMPVNYCQQGILDSSSELSGSVQAVGSKLVNIDLSRQSYTTTGLATPWSYKMTLNKTYKITCTGSGGTATKQITAKMTFKGPQPSIRCTQNSDCGKDYVFNRSASCYNYSVPSGNLPEGMGYVMPQNNNQCISYMQNTCSAGGTLYASCSQNMITCTPINNNQNSYYNNGPYSCPGIGIIDPFQTCVPDWQCSYGPCVNGQQTVSSCTDTKNCGTTTNKPATTKSCNQSQLPTIDIKANGSDGPLTLESNTQVDLSWTSTNASLCTASNGWSGTKAVSGTESMGKLTASKTYTITCSNGWGTISDSANITITRPSVSIKINGSYSVNLSPGGSAVMTWSSTNAVSCTASGDWSGSKALSGTESTGSITSSKTYGIRCVDNAGNSAASQVTATVVTAFLDDLQKQIAALSDAILNLLAR